MERWPSGPGSGNTVRGKPQLPVGKRLTAKNSKVWAQTREDG